MRVITGIAALVTLLGAPVFADDTVRPLTRPDAASVTVPSLAFAPAPRDSGGEYFYFYKPGVSYEAAFADFDTCRMYVLESHPVTTLPKFVPLGGEAVAAERTYVYVPYGLIGALIDRAMEDESNDARSRITWRHCMAYKGYTRYGLSRVLDRQLESGTDTERLARKALIASGAVPAAAAVEP